MASIRTASSSDRDALCALIIAFRDHLGESRPRADELARHLPAALSDPSLEFGIAVSREGQPLGYSSVYLHRSVWDLGWRAHLEDLFVVAERRSEGIGERLLAHAAGRARERGAVSMGLHTNENNHRAHAFYRRAGFRPQTTVAWQGGCETYWTRKLE